MPKGELKDAKTHPITDDYEIGKQLGTGKFSVVKQVTHKQTKKDYAVKMITKTISDHEEVLKEIDIMRAVDEHPGVVHLIDVYEDEEYFYLVLELVTGGELFDKIVEYENYSEKEAANLVYQIASLVSYLHSKNIVHRDLKPENLLFEDAKATTLKLCDFGLAERIEPGEELTNVVGSPTYMAPEILEGVGYGKAVDLYSVGVIMYILLCGYPPFEPEEGIVDLEFPPAEWGGISQSVKDLITQLLDKDPSKRPTADQLLQHSWVKGHTASSKVLHGTIKTMAVYNTVRRNPGETMRRRDPAGGKTPVFNLFASPTGKNTLAPAIAVTPAGSASTAKKVDQKSAQDKKKNRRKTSQAKRHNDDDSSDSSASTTTNTTTTTTVTRSGFSFDIGAQSLLDISKKVAEMGIGIPSTAKPAANSAPANQSELEKLRDLYNSERKKRTTAEEKLAETEAQVSQLEEQNKSLNKKIDELVDKLSIADVKLSTLETEIKKAQKEAAEAKYQAEKAQRTAQEYEKDYQAQHAKLVEALKRANNNETLLKIETIVAERLEGKKIKELEEMVASLKPLAASAKELQEEVAALKEKLAKTQDENKILKMKIEELSS